MKIVDAVWEKRNLGVETVDFTIEENDEIQNVKELLSKYNEPYQVMHVPSGKTDILLSAQRLGFSVIEVNVNLGHQMKDVLIPKLFLRYEKDISYHDAAEEEIGNILSIIEQGEMFVTDKIAKDPFFGKEKSGHRYRCWCEQVLENNASVVVCQYRNENIGFEVYTRNLKTNKATNIVGGVFPKHTGGGLGFAPLWVELLHQKEAGIKSVVTSVSSNNIPVLKLHELLGYRVQDMTYVLVKHLDC